MQAEHAHLFLTCTVSAHISSWRAPSVHSSVPYAHAQHVLKGPLKLMLSIRVRNWYVCSGYASVPDAYAQRMHKFLTCMLRVCISPWCICSACFEGTVLSARISSWCVCSVHASVLTRMLMVYKMNIWKMAKLMCMLSMRVRNCCVWPGCASVPDLYA